MLAWSVLQVPGTKPWMTEKERLLPKLVEEGWLASMPDQQGKYSIGVRNLITWLCGMAMPIKASMSRKGMLAWCSLT